MKVVVALLLAVSFFVLLRGAWYFLRMATRNKSYHHYTLRVFPWVERFVWLAFIFYTLQSFFLHSTVYPFVIISLAVVITLMFGWLVLRDWLLGAVVRSEHALEPGVFIKTGNYSGAISSLGFLSLEIQKEDGEKIKIPYSQVNRNMLAQNPDKGYGKSHRVSVRLPQHQGAQKIQQLLKAKILELPWVVASAKIEIELTPVDNQYVARIQFVSVKDDMAAKTEEIIRLYAEKHAVKDN